MSELLSRSSSRRTNRLRRLATQYVDHGWPVTRVAVQRNGSCSCGLTECAEPHLTLARPALTAAGGTVERLFTHDGWAIALPTHHFDVVEVPAQFGAPLHHQLKTQCPTAIAPATRNWQFVVAQGSISAELVRAAEGRLFSGPDGWVLAPGTHTETTGRTRWLTPPYLTHWTPYQRRDAIDIIFSTSDWSDPHALAPRPPHLVEEVLR
jgi:hypothetical protein